MSMVAIAVIGGAGISAYGAYASSKSASDAAIANSANQNQYLTDSQTEYMDQLNALLGGAGSDVWGSVPEWAPYEPVDITQSQKDTVRGNLENLRGATLLTEKTNESIWENDLNRVRALTPGYDQSVANLSGEIGARLQGQTTLGDTWSNLVSDNASLTAAMGTPGTGQPALAKDIGLTQQDLFNSGASMFTQWLATANESISPISNQMRPQQMMFSPQERLDADLMQAQLIQQSNQSGFNLAAMPDPEAAGEFGITLGALGTSTGAAVGPAPTTVPSGSAVGSAMSAFGQGISSYGGMLGAQATQPTQSTGGIQYQMPSGYGQPTSGYMQGASWSANPYGYAYAPSY